MKPSFRTLAILTLGILLTGKCARGFSQTPAAAPSFAQQFKELSQKWTNKTTANLLAAAQNGEAPAAYFYAVSEEAAAQQAENGHYEIQIAIRHGMTPEAATAAENKWSTANPDELDRAVQAGDPGARMVSARLAIDRDCERGTQAFSWLKKAAAQGFPPAEYAAAVRYLGLSGWMVTPVDVPKGLKYLQQAADHGWAPAQYQLAMQYLRGELTPPDLVKAVAYLQRAADQNGPRSEYELALLYAQGIGNPRGDADTPVALLRKSAQQGFNMALHAMADRYRTGLGVPVDYLKSIQLYEAARAAGENPGTDTECQTRQVFDLVDDRLEPNPGLITGWEDFAKVLSIYLKATTAANAGAMCRLGDWCLAGQFTPRDPAKAFHWYQQAADNGSLEGAAKRDTLKTTLRPDQLKPVADGNE